MKKIILFIIVIALLSSCAITNKGEMRQNIVSKSDSIALVENVDKEVYEKCNLDTTFILELYDELVIEK